MDKCSLNVYTSYTFLIKKHLLKATTLVIASIFATTTHAQLVECELVNQQGNVSAPGGCIGKNLQQQIGQGQGDINTYDSSIYLIKRDPARSIRRGRQLFQRKFTASEGRGPRVNLNSSGDITNNRALGAGDADSCAACHGRPRGSAGFGGDVNTRPDSRDAPHLFGLGIIEQLAEEMTDELRSVKAQALSTAKKGGQSDTKIILEADFTSNPNGFVFSDDVFNTSSAQYSFGTARSRGLVTILGGVDNKKISGISGGWQKTFTLAEAGEVEIQVNYRMSQSSEYEQDELSRAIIAINDQETVLSELIGDGNGGRNKRTGEQTASVKVSLGAGDHTLTLGGFNNKKTYFNERTTITYSDAVLTQLEHGEPGPVTVQLTAKGIDFGQITAFPNGTFDTSKVEGVNENLRVLPFFHQGGTASIREFIIGGLKDEMGLQSPDPILCAVTDPDNPKVMTSPSGFKYDPAADVFERPPVCDTNADGDDDGIVNEIDASLIDHLEFYLLNYFKPGQWKITQRVNEGKQLMDDTGCTSCHVADLVIDSDRRVADVETAYDPVNGRFNQLFATASTRFGDIVDDGDKYPQILPSNEPFVVKNFFSDLKRHDLGEKFHEREFDDGHTGGANRVTEFVTEPLWGVGSTSPYGHDGRSINLDSVIRRHGGEAQSVTDAYVALSEDEQAKIQEFLQSLVLFPPDDTASNLNPGDGVDIQTPAGHGSILLPALFQIPELGSE